MIAGLVQGCRELVGPRWFAAKPRSRESLAEPFGRLPLISACLVVLALAGLTITFGVWTATSILSFPVFLAAVVLLTYFPGRLILALLKTTLEPLEFLTLSVIVGLVASCVVYWVVAFLNVRSVFPIWPLGTLLVSCYVRPPSLARLRGSFATVRGPQLLLIVILLLGIAPMYAFPNFFRDYARLPDGSLSYSGFPDGVLHMGLANEVAHTVPPEVPYLAGIPERYHYGMDIATAMFAQTFRLSVADLTVRFIPTLFVLMTLTAIYIFCRAWFRSPYVAVLGMVLVFFGEDFSFIPGILLHGDGLWNEQFFNSGTITSLYYVNPILPGLGILFASIFCLAKAFERNSWSWLALSALLCASLLDFKVFLYGELIASMAITAGLYIVFARDFRMARLFLASLAMSLPLFALSWWGIDVTASQTIQLDLWPYVIPAAIQQTGAAGTSVGSVVLAMFRTRAPSPAGLAALFLVVLPLYIVGSFGVRTLAIPRLLREFFRPRLTTPPRHCLALFALLGPLVTLTWTVVSRGYDPASQYDNTVWFISQGKYLASIFALEVVVGLARGRSRQVQGLLVAVMLLLSFPSTIRYFVVMSQPNGPSSPFTPAQVEVALFLQRSCDGGAVAIVRERLAAETIALSQCQVPFIENSFAAGDVGPLTYQRRQSDYNAFWSALDKGQVRADILRRYNIGFIVSASRPGAEPPKVEPDILRLAPVYRNAEYTVYRVIWATVSHGVKPEMLGSNERGTST